jgi:nitric oxide reductase activation protein
LRDGDALDLDACVAAVVERRSGLMQEERVFQREATGPRDLSVLLLLDLSQSTGDRDRSGRSILAVEKEAATIMASALEAAGDMLAIHGFCSDGREKVRYLRLKEFAEPLDDIVHARLARLTSSHSTRLGAAIRHAGKQLARQRAFRRALLVLTDGEPSDIDVRDPLYLTEDARRAVLTLRKTGVDVFAFGVGVGPFRSLDRIVGEHRALRVPRIDTLPSRVMQLYAELKK